MGKAKKVGLQLECAYTDAELAEKRDELAGVIIEVQAVEERKKSANSSFKEMLDGLYSQSSELAHQIKSKGEFRLTDCAIEYNSPNIGEKTTIRLDTGEVVKTEPMTHEERQDEIDFSDIGREVAKEINSGALDTDTVKVTAEVH